ncbi:MAG: hypothetical protein JWN02_541, partial [Acidobacteria bacterium]|nr:hypothetical protein [Acidobacteriota bacterium]
MKSVFLGWPAPFDNNKADPAVTVNASGGVTLTHLEGKVLYNRFGTFNKASMIWRVPAPVGVWAANADVANNNTGVLVALEGIEGDAGHILVAPGRYMADAVSWGEVRMVDPTGSRSSVGMNESGLYIVVYQGGQGL